MHSFDFIKSLGGVKVRAISFADSLRYQWASDSHMEPSAEMNYIAAHNFSENFNVSSFLIFFFFFVHFVLFCCFCRCVDDGLMGKPEWTECELYGYKWIGSNRFRISVIRGICLLAKTYVALHQLHWSCMANGVGKEKHSEQCMRCECESNGIRKCRWAQVIFRCFNDFEKSNRYVHGSLENVFIDFVVGEKPTRIRVLAFNVFPVAKQNWTLSMVALILVNFLNQHWTPWIAFKLPTRLERSTLQ